MWYLKFSNKIVFSLSMILFLSGQSIATYDPEAEQLEEVLRLSAIGSNFYADEEDVFCIEQAQLEEVMRLSAEEVAVGGSICPEDEQLLEVMRYTSAPIDVSQEPVVQNIGFNHHRFPVRDLSSAVGKIRVSFVDRHGRAMCHDGTATLIENNIIISAAHVFHSLLPSRGELLQQDGPYYMDLRRYNVDWFYESASQGSVATPIKVVSMVLDAAYIKLLVNPESAESSERQTKYDIAFLRLERAMPAMIPTIPLVSHEFRFSQMCAIYGYGKLENAHGCGRHAIPMLLSLDAEKLERGVLRLQVESNMPHDIDEARKELRYLLGKEVLDIRDAFVSGGPPGDSGGPLLAVTPEGVRVIGVYSGYGVEVFSHSNQVNRLNVCASLIKGNVRHGYNLDQAILLLLHTLKGRAV
ncbi:MAG: trypsin-like serine protease [Alphaproteobacteria bacterium]|nr:trypsin-like serine protease [Alphaproteobacteria bacterium]